MYILTETSQSLFIKLKSLSLFKLYTVQPHLSGLFTDLDTYLGTNPHSSTESDSLIRKFSYLDSQSGNGGVRISEVSLYIVKVVCSGPGHLPKSSVRYDLPIDGYNYALVVFKIYCSWDQLHPIILCHTNDAWPRLQQL